MRRFGELEAAGLVAEAGRAAFAARREDRMGLYTHEQQQPPTLDEAFESRFRAQLDAVASIPGTFAYTPAEGTILKSIRESGDLSD